MQVNMFDPTKNYLTYKSEYDNAILYVLNHGKYINGPEVSILEKELCKYTGAKYCITCSNGTDALKISLMALNIGYGDEVITVSFTWISTVEAICLVNATPIFIDISESDFNINCDLIKEKITDKTKAIIIVSLFGQIPDIDRINTIAEKYNLPVIEDGAQSFGATYKNKKSMNLTTIGTTSFFPSKPLGCFGDGGAIFTNDYNIANKIRALCNHGSHTRFNHLYIGTNARLDTIQASILLIKLKYLDKHLEKRRHIADLYNHKLKKLENLFIKLPKINNNRHHVWAQYSIIINNHLRNPLFDYLKNNGVNLSIYYLKPVHKQPCLNLDIDLDIDLPITNNICESILNLPIYPELQIEEINFIVQLIYTFFEKYKV